MSEDGIHGSPASVEKFARDHPDYNNPNAQAHPLVRRPAHTGGHPPISHKPPKQKHVAVPTTQEHQFTKKTCKLIEISVKCQHDGRKAIKEKDGEYALSVVPHESGPTTSGNTKTSGGIGTKPVQSNAQVEAEDKKHKQTSSDLESEHQSLEDRQAKLAARKDANTGKYRRVAARLNRAKAAHQTRQEEFIKDNRAKNYFGAELYLDQGDPTIDDKMAFKAQMAKHCSKHPAWALWDCSTNEWVDTHQGLDWSTDALLPPVVDYSQMASVLPKVIAGENAYWLKSLEPRLYKVHLYTCEGEEVIHIKVYPLVESGIDISIEHEGSKNDPAHGSWAARITESKEKFESVVETISQVAPGGGSVSLEILPEGKFSLFNEWVEEEATNEVVWEADAVVKATIIKLTILRPIVAGLPEAVMKAIRSILDAGLDIKASVEASANVTCKWKQAPEKEMQFEPSGGIGGEAGLGLWAHLHLGMPILNENVLSLDAEAKTVAEISSTITPKTEGGEEKVLLDVKGKWAHPLVVNYSVAYLMGKPISSSKDLLGPLPEHSFGSVHLW